MNQDAVYVITSGQRITVQNPVLSAGKLMMFIQRKQTNEPKTIKNGNDSWNDNWILTNCTWDNQTRFSFIGSILMKKAWQRIRCALGFHYPDPNHDCETLSARQFKCKYCERWTIIMYGAG